MSDESAALYRNDTWSLGDGFGLGAAGDQVAGMALEVDPPDTIYAPSRTHYRTPSPTSSLGADASAPLVAAPRGPFQAQEKIGVHLEPQFLLV